ncbi:hypothetical protein V5P93_006470 [Actinokineospora auranticolor]|uniref:Secreted protein n=1 Tax=Actinokineospora auranticolor TaxID=155976 RepID=A0A2S6GXK0_9PSEU|nr:hypothetical protein [Actinokineospora auranticolor]PPK69891.1 hypothetical protein CLV40_103501 [Actinokineospora auranticolor]
MRALRAPAILLFAAVAVLLGSSPAFANAAHHHAAAAEHTAATQHPALRCAQTVAVEQEQNPHHDLVPPAESDPSRSPGVRVAAGPMAIPAEPDGAAWGARGPPRTR